jgi:hypothetical protein
MLRSIKDRAVSAAASGKIGRKLDGVCDNFSLSVDSKAKVLIVEALPAGETEMVRVEISGYRLERQGKEAVLEFEDLTVSRPWMQALAETFLADKRLQLPPGTPYDLLKLLF